MAIKNYLSIEQHTFPQGKKEIYVDVSQGKISVRHQSWSKKEELIIDIDRLSPNPQKIKKWAVMWFFVTLCLSVYFVASVSAWFWQPPLAGAPITLSFVGQALLLVAALLSGWRFFTHSFDQTIFFDKYTHLPLLHFTTNKPDAAIYNHFVTMLIKIVLNQEQTRTLRTLLYEIPTHILVDEVSTSFLEELAKRGIDVGALLGFLQKRALHAQDSNERPSLQ